MKNSVKKSKTNLNAAEVVIKEFPSFDELINDDKYGVNYILHPLQRFAFSKSNQWEGIAIGINNMCSQMFGREFYTSYLFNNSKGSASVLPAYGDEIEVDFNEFQALIKIMMIFNMGLVTPTTKQIKAYENFKYNNPKIYKILD
jgi:hypothetical protein